MISRLRKLGSTDQQLNLTLVVDNSFVKVVGANKEAEELIESKLTYKNDFSFDKSRIFYSLKKETRKQKRFLLYKQLKEIEEKEVVCWYKHKSFPSGHLNLIIELLTTHKIPHVVQDQRIKPKSYLNLTWANTPIEPRYYQAEMIRQGVEHGRGVFCSAVGSGKTLVMINLIKILQVNSLVIVPSLNLLEQIKANLEDSFGAKKVHKITTSNAKKSKKVAPIQIVSIQTLNSLRKQGLLEQALESIDAFYGDEFHHAGAESWTAMLPELNHIYYKFGFSGSFLRNDNKELDMWGVISNVLYEYTPRQAIMDGYLTPINVQVHNIKGVFKQKYQTEYSLNYCSGIETGETPLLREIKNIINSISTKEQILILVDRKDQSGYNIARYLQSLEIGCVFISGDNEKDFVKQTIQDFNAKKIRILIGSKVLGEGVDICSTDHLLMAQGGKSKTNIIQALGRLVRLYPGKVKCTLHDFSFDGTKYLNKHLDMRLEIYKTDFGATGV